MNVFLWIIAVLLAVAFVGAGLMHLLVPKERLDKNLGWPEAFPAGTVRLIGTAEFLGGLGMVLPAAIDVVPVLTPIAAAGLAVVMLGAMATHVRRREPQGVTFTLVLLAMAVVVAWGRLGPYAF